MTEGAGGGYLGGKTAELSISSSKATGSNKSIVMPDSKSLTMGSNGQGQTPAGMSLKSETTIHGASSAPPGWA